MPTLSFSQAVLQNNLPEVTKWLTQSPPADINEMILINKDTGYSGTPLHCAITQDNLELFTLLLSHHPDLGKEDSIGLSPIQIATVCVLQPEIKKNKQNIFMTLVKAGLSLDFSLVDLPIFGVAEKEEKERVAQEAAFLKMQASLAKTADGWKEFKENAEEQKLRTTIKNNELAHEKKEKKVSLKNKMEKVAARPVQHIVGNIDLFLEFIRCCTTEVPAVDIQSLLEIRSELEQVEFDEEYGNKEIEFRKLDIKLLLLKNVPTLRQLFTKINALQTYGETLEKDADSEQIGSKTCDLAASLYTSMESLVRTIHSGKPNDIQAAQKEWETQLEKGMVDMREHRGVFYQLLNIFIAFVREFLGLKDASDAHGFFHTNRQKQLTGISEDIHSLLAQSIHEIKPLESEAEPIPEGGFRGEEGPITYNSF